MTRLTLERRAQVYPYIRAAFVRSSDKGGPKVYRKWRVCGRLLDTVQFAAWLSERVGFQIQSHTVIAHLKYAQKWPVPRAVVHELEGSNDGGVPAERLQQLRGAVAVVPIQAGQAVKVVKAVPSSPEASRAAQFYKDLRAEGLDHATAVELTKSRVSAS